MGHAAQHADAHRGHWPPTALLSDDIVMSGAVLPGGQRARGRRCAGRSKGVLDAFARKARDLAWFVPHTLRVGMVAGIAIGRPRPLLQGGVDIAGPTVHVACFPGRGSRPGVAVVNRVPSVLLGNQGQRFGDLQRRQVKRRSILIDHARQIALGGGQANACHVAGCDGAATGRAFGGVFRRHQGR